MGDGDAYCPEVAGLCGICSSLCGFRLLCCVDHLHPADYGGPLSFPARTPSTLVRMIFKGCANYLGGMKLGEPQCYSFIHSNLEQIFTLVHVKDFTGP